MIHQEIARAETGEFSSHKNRMAQIRAARFTPTQRLLVAAASMFCGRSDRCFCTVERLASDIGCHQKTAARLLGLLERQRLLAWAERGPGLSPWMLFDWRRLTQYEPPAAGRKSKQPKERQLDLFEDHRPGDLTAAGVGVGEAARTPGQPAAAGEPAKREPGPAPRIPAIVPNIPAIVPNSEPIVPNSEPIVPNSEPIVPRKAADCSAPHTNGLRQQENKKAPKQNAAAFAACVEFCQSIGWRRSPTPAEIRTVAATIDALSQERVGKEQPNPVKVAAAAAALTRDKFKACKTLAGSLPYWRDAYRAAAARMDHAAAAAIAREDRRRQAAELDRRAALERSKVDQWRRVWESMAADAKAAFRGRVLAANPALHALAGSAFVDRFVVQQFAACGGQVAA